MVEPGRTCLGGRYELGRLIASGGMGQVWRGTDVLLGRPVAVKVLRSEFTGDPSFLARFRAEAQNAAALSHPHIAAVFDYGETTAEDGSGETLAYLVMELIEGEPLAELLRRSGRLDTATTLRILGQTAAGLAEAHRAGMVHRDVKPANLLITPDGDVKITDFGIAWSARSVALTRTGQVLGTPQYLSPEQAEGRLATPASDVYALGLIGYECLAGHAAFDGDNAVTIALKQVREEPEPLPEDLPASIRALVARATAKDPERRMPDGAAFLAAIEAVRAGRSIDPPPATAVLPRRVRGAAASRRGRRRRVAVVLVPLIGLLVGAGVAAVVLQNLTDSGSSTAEAAQQRDGEQTILLDPGNYVGRPADEVADELVALGLDVARETRRTDAVAPGTVAALEPADTALAPGDTVVLVIAVAPGDGSAGSTGATGAVPEGTAERSRAGTPPAPGTAPRTAAPEDTAEGTAPGTGEAPAEEPPAEEPPAEEPPAEEPPAEEPPAEEPPVEEPPAEEPPVEEPPAEEPPVEEPPAEEPPAEEPPAEDLGEDSDDEDSDEGESTGGASGAGVSSTSAADASTG